MPEKKYKIAVITTHIIQYAVPLYQKMHHHPEIDLTIYFCSNQGMGSKKDKDFGIKIKWDNIDLSGLKYKFLKNFSFLPNVSTPWGLINLQILKEIKENQYDAVMIGGYYTISFWLGFLICTFTKTPMILSGEPPSPWRSRLRRYIASELKKIFMPHLLNFSSAILYIGKRSKDYYLSYKEYTTNLEEKLFFTPYAVDNDFLCAKFEEFKNRKKELKQALGIPTDYPVILFLSKLIKWKRPLTLLKVFRNINNPASLVYVGSGYRLKALREFAHRFQIKNVFFFGFQNYSELPKFYAMADIFVLPSLGESWGLVINEAMCFNLPVVTTNKVASAYDLVRDGENGYVLNTAGEHALAEKINHLLKFPERRQVMGEKSKEIILNWNYQRCVEGILQALDFIYKR